MKHRPKSDKWKKAKHWKRLEREARSNLPTEVRPDVAPIIRLKTKNYYTAEAMLRTSLWRLLGVKPLIV